MSSGYPLVAFPPLLPERRDWRPRLYFLPFVFWGRRLSLGWWGGVRPHGDALRGGRTLPRERLALAGDGCLHAGDGRTHGDLGLGLAVLQDVRGV